MIHSLSSHTRCTHTYTHDTQSLQPHTMHSHLTHQITHRRVRLYTL